MKIGVLGPTRINEFCQTLDVQKAEYIYFLEKVAEHLASTKHEIVIMPAHDTSQGVIASAYKDFKGVKVIGLIPEDDTEWGLLNIDPHVADENINCGNWRNQPEKLCEESDVFLCVGLSPGSMIELCYSKWFKVKKVYVMTDFMSQKLPPEVEKDLSVEYITINELDEKIK
ncbi:hypothetical protein ACFLTH_13440 [Bacteroidota bacterium]